jgi:hypothetical protein
LQQSPSKMSLTSIIEEFFFGACLNHDYLTHIAAPYVTNFR